MLAYNRVKNISISGMSWITWIYLFLLGSSSRIWSMWAIRGRSLANGIPDVKLASPHKTLMSSISTSTAAFSNMSTIFLNSVLPKKKLDSTILLTNLPQKAQAKKINIEMECRRNLKHWIFSFSFWIQMLYKGEWGLAARRENSFDIFYDKISLRRCKFYISSFHSLW